MRKLIINKKRSYLSCQEETEQDQKARVQVQVLAQQDVVQVRAAVAQPPVPAEIAFVQSVEKKYFIK